MCVLNNLSPPAGTSASYRGHAEEPDDKYNQRARVTTGGYRGPHGEPLPEDGSVGRYEHPPPNVLITAHAHPLYLHKKIGSFIFAHMHTVSLNCLIHLQKYIYFF